MQALPTPVTVVIVPRFPLHALALCVDALRVANRAALATVFTWQVAAETAARVPSSAGIEVTPDTTLDAVARAPVVVLLAAYEPELAGSARLLAWLRRQDRRGALLGCVDTGALLLARAGLLREADTSIHADALAGAREAFRGLRFDARLFRVDLRRCSSAGGVATLDMMLALIEQRRGRALADRVAVALNHARRDAGAQPAEARAAIPVSADERRLAGVLELMQSHLEDPLGLSALGECTGLNEWTLRRLFRRHLGTTPGAHYRRLRLDRARQLLAYSRLPVAEIAAATGFADGATLTHAFRRRFGRPPSRCRDDESGLPPPAAAAPPPRR